MKNKVENLQNYWKKKCETIEKSDEKEFYESCRKWVESPSDPKRFKEFFGILFPRTKDETGKISSVVGGEGKYKKVTGNALHLFVYSYLRKRIPSSFDIKVDSEVAPNDQLSIRPDVSVWRNDPLKIVECKVGCGTEQLRSLALEQQMLNKFVPTTIGRLLVVTREGLKEGLTRHIDEYAFCCEWVEVHYFPIEHWSRGDLEVSLNKFYDSLVSGL